MKVRVKLERPKREAMLYHGDCIEVMAKMDAESVDAIVTDPPYGLSFMGKNWDHGIPGAHFWTEALRVAKPGAHLLAFGGTRTFHRLACAIEDAGWEIRDTMGWLYGSGFPKSLDVSKAIDKAAGAKREVVGMGAADCEYLRRGEPCRGHGDAGKSQSGATVHVPATAPATDLSRRWSGWGTALKPAWEPIIVARKPLAGTIAANVLKHGTGAMNIDGCRVDVPGEVIENHGRAPTENGWDPRMSGGQQPGQTAGQALGRWPANIIHDGSAEVLGVFPNSKTARCDKPSECAEDGQWGTLQGRRGPRGYDGDGSAARFFYCAKASKADRDEGCDGLDEKQKIYRATANGTGDISKGMERFASTTRNHHPTVKPTALMRYLCRLVTPPRGIVLDPFMGSGSTGKAAMLEGFRFIGIEKEGEYMEIAHKRIEHAGGVVVIAPACVRRRLLIRLPRK